MTTSNPFDDFEITWDLFCGMDDKDIFEAYQRLLKASKGVYATGYTKGHKEGYESGYAIGYHRIINDEKS